MAPHSNTMLADEFLPPDEISVAQQGPEWRPKPKSSWPRWICRARFGLAWCTLVLFGSSLIWSLTWFQPQKQIHLSLIGASYATNLSVSHNVHGWNDLGQLASLAHSESHLSQFVVAGPPLALNQNTAWDAELERTSEETVVIYFSAHGAADEQGPYLLPLDCQPTADSRLTIEKVIERLGQAPTQQKKFLILDAAHFQTNSQYGILHNDFARALLELNDRILAVPNLVVLSASGANQRTWNYAAQHRSVFGHFFIEGIRGAASDQNNNGRIDAEDLFQFTQANVETWVRKTFQKRQCPILLPGGDEGKRRASRLDLATIRTDYAPPGPQIVAPAPDNQLRKIWNSYHALLARPVKPFAYAPGRWRQYEQAILRYEQLVIANDQQSANQMVELISSLQHQFEWAQERSLAAEHGNLFIGNAILGQSGDPQ